jgi:hypothetical protein
MKVLFRNHEPNKEILEKNGICAIYYNSRGEWIAELDGSGYLTGHNEIFDKGSNSELLKDIGQRVKHSDGENMTEDEVEKLKQNINFDFEM